MRLVKVLYGRCTVTNGGGSLGGYLAFVVFEAIQRVFAQRLTG